VLMFVGYMRRFYLDWEQSDPDVEDPI